VLEDAPEFLLDILPLFSERRDGPTVVRRPKWHLRSANDQASPAAAALRGRQVQRLGS
jgi:hypothetical protein